MYDVIIIGAGIAGLTAAIYACRAKKSVLCIESTTYGGQIINTARIENYPATPHISGLDLATATYQQAEDFGTEFVFEKVIEIHDKGTSYKRVITEDSKYKGRTVIIATGSTERHLGLENEQSLIGKGVSYCATCDGNFFKDQDVAVNGGGNTAMWDALYLSGICKTVTIIHRRDEFRADAHLLDLVKRKHNVKFITNVNVTNLLTDKETGKLSSIEVADPTGKTTNVPVTGLFVAIGRIPTTDPFTPLINVNESGYIIAGEDCHTNIPGIFAAGDTRTKSLHQLVTAASDGAIAATEAIDYLNNL
ncbi:FAD-dependent oxidoreductase [Candidatus Saccharibacteria bacterium]|nr:FAD-dependent oxidoreductase [Candidatus Saccharibacteria bacterium]